VKDNEGNIFAKGLWKDIKELCETRKVHFIANLYAAIKVDGVLELAVIELSGTSLVAFGELSTALSKSTGKATAIYNNAITVSHVIEKKKGSVNYVVPNFIVKKEGVSAETNAQADVLAKQATEYLEQYFSTNTVSATPLQAPEAPKEEPKQESKPEVQQQAPQNIPSRQQQEVQQESHQVNFEGSNGIEEELCPF
jgi:hypothetical protein